MILCRNILIEVNIMDYSLWSIIITMVILYTVIMIDDRRKTKSVKKILDTKTLELPIYNDDDDK